jgi:sulfatase maturation enzyme AslB (radical SAM superfamily)
MPIHQNPKTNIPTMVKEEKKGKKKSSNIFQENLTLLEKEKKAKIIKGKVLITMPIDAGKTA